MEVRQGGYLRQGGVLHVPGQGRREAVEVVFLGGAAFGLEEELVGVALGKSDDLGLDAGAVAGADALYGAVVEGGAAEGGAERVVHGLVGMQDIAAAWRQCAPHLGQIGEFVVVAHEVSLGVKAVVALLLGAEGEVDAGAVQAHRRAGFHAPGLEAEGNELLCDAPGSGFRETSA